MSYVTFTKYCHQYHNDMVIQRAKDDACDTCVRLSIAVADPNLTDEDIEMLLEAQRTHATSVRTHRVALKTAIKVRFRLYIAHKTFLQFVILLLRVLTIKLISYLIN